MKKLFVALFIACGLASSALAQLPGMQAYPLLNAETLAPIGTPTSIAANTASYTSLLTTGTATTSANIASGDLACVAIGVSANSAPPITAVTDGTNTYSSDVSVSGTFTTTALWCKPNATAVSSGATITVTFTATAAGAGNYYNICAMTVSGIIAASPNDKSASQATTTASPSATTAALAQANELALGASAAIGSVTSTQDGNYTTLCSQNQGTQPLLFGWRKPNSASAQTYNPTNGASVPNALVISTYKGN